MNKNTAARAKLLEEILAKNFEQGRQDKCKTQVWRKIIVKTYPMSRRTFFRYLERARRIKN